MPKAKPPNKARIDPRDVDLDDDTGPELDDAPRARSIRLQKPALGKGTEIEAMVIGIWARGCEAVASGELLECDFSPAIRLDDDNDLAVGDRVVVRREGSRSTVTEIKERTSELSRPDPLHTHRQRVIAANIDLVVHVGSVVTPPLRPRLIDRYLVAIASGGATPLIVVNKIDLVPPAERERELAGLQPYHEIGVPILICSVKSHEGLDELRQRILGRTSVFVGHSGVGKSSIIRALKPELTIRVGGVREKKGTGRHTTTRSTLYGLGADTHVIDTPGIREFGLWQIDSRELRLYFPEFELLAGDCRYHDCTHIEEPECAIRPAVEDRRIRPSRYETYVKMLEEIRAEEKARFA